MNDYFDKETQYLNEEILKLKTSAQKSAVFASTIAKSVNITANLTLDDEEIAAGAYKEYKMNTDPDSLIMITLNKYYDDVTKGSEYPRTTRHYNCRLNNKNNSFMISVSILGTQNDINVIKGGGSVTVSLTLTVRCTNDFSLEAQ